MENLSINIKKPREVTPEGGQSYTPSQQTSTGNPTEVVDPSTCPDDLPF